MPVDAKKSKEQRESLIARGDLLLKQLAEEAAAARAEARHAELQRLMDEARNGNVAPLDRWLSENSPSPSEASPINRRFENEQVAGKKDASRSEWSWEWMREPALARLRMRFPEEIPPQPGPAKFAGEGKRPASSQTGQTKGKSETAKAEKTANKLKHLAVEIGQGEQQAGNRQASRKRGAWFSKVSGAATSAIAHIVLVAVLALITLQAPKAPAGMSFDVASSPIEENVELTQPVDVETPETPEPTAETEVSADFDFAETIETVAPSESLGDLGPVGDALSPAALSSAMQTMSAPSVSSANFFGAAAGGNCFCYVIDGSGSMRGGPWEAAKFELFKSLDSLSAKQRFYIIFFGRDFEAIPMPGEREPASRALYATLENVGHAKKWVNGLDFVPGGPPINAIEFAIEKEPDAIYLLTDGVTSVKTVAEKIKAVNVVEDLINGEQVRSTIHAISFYSLEGEQLMRQIASDNKGQFIYVPDPRKP